MRDFKYTEFISHQLPWRHAVVRSPLLKECRETFLGNLLRTALFGMMPTEIAFQLYRDVVFSANAVFRATGETKTPNELSKTPLTAAMKKELDKQVAEDVALSEHESQENRWNMGVRYVETMLGANPAMRSSMDAIFTSVVLESWTAFETLAGDAWVVLVNNGPTQIANKVQEAKKSREEEGYESPYDVRTHLGEYLRDVRAYSFQKVYGIKTAYGKALGNAKTDEIFNVEEGRIVLLAAVRNAITHSGGKVDKRFQEQVGRFPDFVSLSLGTNLKMNGEFVAQLRDAAALTGMAILNALDDVLSPVVGAT